jgi:hypothetical protein
MAGSRPDADLRHSRSRGDVDQRRRREFEDGQRGERECRHQSKVCDTGVEREHALVHLHLHRAPISGAI